MLCARLVGEEHTGWDSIGHRADQTRAFGIKNAGLREALSQTGQNGNRRRWCAVVIALKSIKAVGVRSENRNRFIGTSERKKMIFVLEHRVLQQNQRFL